MSQEQRIAKAKELMINYLENKDFEVHKITKPGSYDLYAICPDCAVLITPAEDGCYTAVAVDLTRGEILDIIDELEPGNLNLSNEKRYIGPWAYNKVMNLELKCSNKLNICDEDMSLIDFKKAVEDYQKCLNKTYEQPDFGER